MKGSLSAVRLALLLVLAFSPACLASTQQTVRVEYVADGELIFVSGEKRLTPDQFADHIREHPLAWARASTTVSLVFTRDAPLSSVFDAQMIFRSFGFREARVLVVGSNPRRAVELEMKEELVEITDQR